MPLITDIAKSRDLAAGQRQNEETERLVVSSMEPGSLCNVSLLHFQIRFSLCQYPEYAL